MNLMPALQQQKVLIVSAIAVVAIVFLGSWVVSRNNLAVDSNGIPIDSDGSQGSDNQPEKKLTLILQPTATKSGNEQSYTLKVAETSETLQSVGLRLIIDGGTVTGSEQKNSFTSNSELTTSGWVAATNTAIVTENNRSTLQVGFVNLKPEGGPVSESLVLGTFTIDTSTGGSKLQFTVDQSVSTAFTKDGSPMTIDLVIESKAAE
jgi:hypothetical protein